jgi:glucan phosphoethanolaminetransferase (alkaline phosphatase superfamily)
VGSFNALTLNPLFFYSKIQEKPERLLEKCIAYRPSHSLHTSIFALSCAIIQKYVKVPSPNYKPYSYHHIDSQTKNIILIIGESLSSEHLKVFGYPRDTMPYIESMTKNSKFFLKKAFSSGVGTKVSLTLFFNVIREPNNQEALLSRQGNLFKQAKAHGFKTILLSNNTGSIVIDGPIDIDQRPLFLDNSQGISSGLFGELGDRAFPMLLSKISLGEKNFIVLHMNAPHSPYDQHYQALGEKFLLYKTDQFDKRNSFINSYDNCLRYVDEEVFKPLIKTFKEIFKNRGESHLIFISDHGELFGEKDPITHLDLFGHGHLNIKSAKVPFWMYSLNTKDESYVKKVLSQPSLASYEVAKMILMLMGTQVENPNEQEGMYYVSADLLSNHFIEYKKY